MQNTKELHKIKADIMTRYLSNINKRCRYFLCKPQQYLCKFRRKKHEQIWKTLDKNKALVSI